MKEASVVEKVREIVSRHTLPDFIIGLDVRLGDIDGDPTMWLIFKTTQGPKSWSPEAERRIDGITAVKEALLPELITEFDDWFPYFRFESQRELKSVAG